MKKILNVLFILMLALSVLTACGCEHVDKNDDALCDECGDAFSDGKDLSDPCEHRDANDDGKCDKCGEGFMDGTDVSPTIETYLRCDKEGNADPNGEYILFGEYPQTIKANDVTITSTQDARGYYLGSDGFFYAAVKAEPFLDGYTFTTGARIKKSAVYYFKVEPIRWRIYLEDEERASILCDSIIDSKAYQSSYKFDSETGAYYATVSDAPAEIYQNNYAYSEVRAWLNAQFYEIAFSDLQRSAIIATTVGNSEITTGYPTNPYVCENTEDFIYLPSHLIVTKSAYGFSSVAYNRDAARQMQTSDYARASGVYMQTNEADYGMGNWWLRSPYYEYSNYVREVRSGGDASYRNSISAEKENGVVPALKLRLQ